MTLPEVLRTPDERFVDLPDYEFPPNYVDDLPGYEGLRGHYLDLGPNDASRTFLCLHGEPSWAYLYRKMIPTLLHSGARVIVPDFFGFGRSDKPIEDAVYTFNFHRNYLLRLVERLDLRAITLVVQDWGGTLGMTLPVDAAFRARLSRLFIMNTLLPIGEPLGPHYYAWRDLVRSTPVLPVGEWIRHDAPALTEAEVAAYDAPFPDRRYQAGARVFPELAMVDPEMEGVAEARAAAIFWSEEWSGPTFMAYGSRHPDGGEMEKLRSKICGCPSALVLPQAGHFVQEVGAPLAEAALRAFGDA